MPLHRQIPSHQGNTRAILIVEMLSIIVAVALGFFVTELREDINNSRRADAALAAITSEIALNRAQLAERVPYYERVTAALDSLSAIHGSEPFDGSASEGWHGLNPPFLRGAAYEAASATGALSHMELAVANRVATAYLAQEMVEETSQIVLRTYDAVLAGLASQSDGSEQG